jgi:hypothetical protein
MALIVPNTEAVAGKHESSASKIMIAIDRFDILIPRRNRSQVPVFLQTANRRYSLAEKSAKSLAYSRNNSGAFGISLESEKNAKPAKNQLSYYFSALQCSLDEGRTAIRMGRKAGSREHNRNKVNLAVAHCRWGKVGIRGNCCATPQVSRRTAIHGTLGIIGRR